MNIIINIILNNITYNNYTDYKMEKKHDKPEKPGFKLCLWWLYDPG